MNCLGLGLCTAGMEGRGLCPVGKAGPCSLLGKEPLQPAQHGSLYSTFESLLTWSKSQGAIYP